jgi:hypothetical protein
MATKQLVATADELFAGRAYDSGLYGVQKAWMHVSDANAATRNGLLGKVQYAG